MVDIMRAGECRGEGEGKPPGRVFDPRAIMEECHNIARKRSYASVGGA